MNKAYKCFSWREYIIYISLLFSSLLWTADQCGCSYPWGYSILSLTLILNRISFLSTFLTNTKRWFIWNWVKYNAIGQRAARTFARSCRTVSAACDCLYLFLSTLHKQGHKLPVWKNTSVSVYLSVVIKGNNEFSATTSAKKSGTCNSLRNLKYTVYFTSSNYVANQIHGFTY